MWHFTQVNIKHALHFALHYKSVPATYEQALTGLQDEALFRSLLINTLRTQPFFTYKWETPALSTQLSGRQFEFVLTEAPWLDRTADSSDFSTHLIHREDDVVEFTNLGGDAQLLVPTDRDPATNYCHLGSFTLTAPEHQQHALWQAVGKMGLKLMNNEPIWISTAGDGVPWLHMRFDQTPKYYVHTEFTRLEND